MTTPVLAAAKQASKPKTRASQKVQLFASALWAGLTAYLVGAVFSSTGYTLFPYFMVPYTSGLYKIASTMTATSSAQTGKENTVSERRGGTYSGPKPELVWTR